eukprot:1797432-Prymnesium_polylepis.1
MLRGKLANILCHVRPEAQAVTLTPPRRSHSHIERPPGERVRDMCAARIRKTAHTGATHTRSAIGPMRSARTPRLRVSENVQHAVSTVRDVININICSNS